MTKINIGLHLNGQIINLHIPRDVTIKKLRNVLFEKLEAQGIHLPSDIGFRVFTHALYHEEDTLTDGDQIGVELTPGSYTRKGIVF